MSATATRAGSLDWATMKWILLAFGVGAGYSDLRAQQSSLARELVSIKVIVCRTAPTDSECK